MGLLDFDTSKITGNDAFQLGMNILGNNQGYYGNTGMALGAGLQDYQRQKSLQAQQARANAQAQYQAQMQQQQQEMWQQKQAQYQQAEAQKQANTQWMTSNMPKYAGAPQSVQQAAIKQQFSMPKKRDTAKDKSGRLRYLDSGKNVFNLPEGTQQPITEEAFKRETALRGEFNKKTMPFAKINDSYGRIIASAKDPSAAGDMALIFNYMKILDPGSTVREGEFQTAQDAGGVKDKWLALRNQVLSGKRLSEAQRVDFTSRAGMLYNEALDANKKRSETYTGLSERYEVDPTRVVIPRKMHERYAPAPQQPAQAPQQVNRPATPKGAQTIQGVNYPVTMTDSRTDPKTGNLISQGNDGNFYEKTATGWRQIK